jgi:hypothetical protein
VHLVARNVTSLNLRSIWNREREVGKWRGDWRERETARVRGGQKHVPVLKVPRQCSLVLLVEVRERG